ncbi:MAG: amidohydrolase [Dehalococcoidia bacterium]|uniref:amidohydrolase n=1 Tax=Candidatus Amarobacter glycogenicus TaxID=3140699 RepID=UPI003135DF0D|nr:amidohydrolase [Dehalococcoidia bacterium]
MPGDRAELIFTNGIVHTVDANNSIAEAVAVSDGRILAVGSNAEVSATAGPATERVDLRGRSLTPGFIDAHHHFTGLGSGSEAIDCKAAGMDSIRAIVEEVRKRAAALPAGTWIRGRGYDHSRLVEQRHPNRHDFDAVAPEHPVIFTRTCGHILAFNTKAIELAGLSLTAPDIDGGRYDRDGDGRLLGVSYERANAPIQIAAAASRAELRQWLKAANDSDLASGLTSIHDAGGLTGVSLDIAKELVDADEIQVRIYSFVTVNAPDHPHVGILSTGVRTGLGDERLRMGAFKVVTDGSSSGPTAATREPYASNSDDRGIAYWKQDDLDSLIGRAHRAGWQCTVHAVGDRAIEQTLDAMARAQAEYPRQGLRHRIEHCGITPPDLQRRVRAQGIVPAMQPAFFWEFGDGYIRNYGRERADVMFPAKSLLEAGVIVAGSSDSPVTDYRPLFGIEQAQTRATSGGDVCGPNERVDLAMALRMHTINGAYASFEERIKGSIERGKLADVVVLSGDIRKVPVRELRDLPIAMTVVGGRVVYEG